MHGNGDSDGFSERRNGISEFRTGCSCPHDPAYTHLIKIVVAVKATTLTCPKKFIVGKQGHAQCKIHLLQLIAFSVNGKS